MEAALTGRKAPTIEDNENEQEQYDECDDHYKEPKPEELSLLGNSCDQVSQSLRHLSVGKRRYQIELLVFTKRTFRLQICQKLLQTPPSVRFYSDCFQ